VSENFFPEQKTPAGKKKSGFPATIVIVGGTLVLVLLIGIQLVKGNGGQTAARGAPPAGQGQNTGQQGAARGGGQEGQKPGGQAGQQSAQGGGQMGQRGGAVGQPARTASAVRARQVELGTIENSVVLGGEVLASSQAPMYPVVAGKLIELRVKAGDRVQKGQVIARIDPSRPGDSFFASPVTSTVAGTVLSTPLSVGDTVQTGTVICVIGDVNRLRVETFVPERFSVNMRIGLPAQARFEAIPGETFPAVVDEMSPVLDPASRTRRILLGFTGAPDPRVMAGMYATLSLVTNSRADVPVIPRQSLINTYGSWIVYVIEGSGETTAARRREVTTGLENEEMVEITGGIGTGDRVVVEGQTFLSDGDPVRIVE
jgi:multidrug efflux pump subunit AcrA (membrane-fusion protein)